ncbi:MAG: dephospho-CoA kinase [Alcanivorax sp.]|jgi:dephospho-CoA kinase
MALIIGITGGIGSGKSAVTNRFEALNITVVDADKVARTIVKPDQPALKKIAEHFGADILLADGSLDRAALRATVFSQPQERLWLEALTHPLIREEMLAQLNSSRSPYTILSSPLLLETSQKSLAELVIVVDVPEQLQLERTVQRDNNDADQVGRIMAAQMSRSDRLKLADIVIDNSGALDKLDEVVRSLHHQFLTREKNN